MIFEIVTRLSLDYPHTDGIRDYHSILIANEITNDQNPCLENINHPTIRIF